MIFMALQDTLLAELADLSGHSTALHLQVISQRLPVEGNSKAIRTMIFCLPHQIGHQLFPGSTLARNFDLLAQLQIALGYDL